MLLTDTLHIPLSSVRRTGELRRILYEHSPLIRSLVKEGEEGCVRLSRCQRVRHHWRHRQRGRWAYGRRRRRNHRLGGGSEGGVILLHLEFLRIMQGIHVNIRLGCRDVVRVYEGTDPVQDDIHALRSVHSVDIRIE